MREEPRGPRDTLFQDSAATVRHVPRQYAVLDRTKLEGGDLRLTEREQRWRTSRWCVYDLTVKYFGAYQCFSSRAKALAFADKRYGWREGV